MKTPTAPTGLRIQLLIIVTVTASSLLVDWDVARSQPAENTPRVRVWVDGGVGFSTAGDGPETTAAGGLSARAAINLQVNRLVITVPATTNTGGKSAERGFLGYRYDTFTDLSLMFGTPLMETEKSALIMSIGMSQISGSLVATEQYKPFCLIGPCRGTATRYTKESFNGSMGIPIEIGYYHTGGENYGTAIIGHMNFSGDLFFAAITLNLTIGRRN